ncbi:MAG: formyltetrahydrofolate deformylase [SAR86 cluster bacterium SAR86B]|uniref:Formyltetrahydrofolate deformylase n=1 Tax=SAR86 cluster bacterium SAR86B TaxID=1123867 RepID=J4KT75_9GAMM|nr:MAG: formyltetrahydrofolate deformylase [SAR86 cluster bacterium SAR86B]
MKKEYVLTFSCPDQKGIQAKTSSFLFSNNAFLTDVQSYSDKKTQSFFSRIVFSLDDLDGVASSFMSEFDVLASELSMKWNINDLNKKTKTLIAVSKEGHCLNDLLYRAKYKDMPIDIVGVVSNHETFKEIVEFNGYQFHHLPIINNDKKSQEKEFHEIAIQAEAELIVLARYMQILSQDFVSKWSNNCINIHHSFLPSFKGSKPYHQAYNKA